MGEDCFDRKVDKSDRRRKDRGKIGVNGRKAIGMATSRALDDVADDIEFLDCYTNNVDRLSSSLSNVTHDQLELNRTNYQSDFIANNLAFSSSISAVLEKFLRRVRDHLRPLPRGIKEMLVGVESKILPFLQSVIGKYLESVRAFAKKIGVQNFSIAIGSSLVSFTFTFGV